MTKNGNPRAKQKMKRSIRFVGCHEPILMLSVIPFACMVGRQGIPFETLKKNWLASYIEQVGMVAAKQCAEHLQNKKHTLTQFEREQDHPNTSLGTRTKPTNRFVFAKQISKHPSTSRRFATRIGNPFGILTPWMVLPWLPIRATGSTGHKTEARHSSLPQWIGSNKQT